MNNVNISVVIPVYGCSKSLGELYTRLINTIETIAENFEIIMINDASPDDAWPTIKRLAEKDARVKGINLSRNFGQHYAISAGLDYVNGDWIIVMDCDLQDQPEEIVKLYNKALEGYDIVFGRRYNRNDSFVKKIGSKLFYKIYDYFTESKIDHTVANFSIISFKVVKELRRLREHSQCYPLFVGWLGFKRTNIDIEHAKRGEGKSSYTFKKLRDLAIDSIISQSNKPLRLSIQFGFSISFLSICYAFWLFIRYFLYQIEVEGWTSVMVSIYFIGGLLFANLGLLGLYIGKIFDETKNRSIYVIHETTFEKDNV